jgi:hypothetical protein
MPSQLTYPGVYIEEVPSGIRTIVGVSTSVTAFVGRARRGAVDKPIVVTSFGEFERAFGGLWKLSRLGFSVRDFFLNGGSAAVIVRVVNDAANDADDPTASSVELGLDGDPALLTLEAVDVGLWGDSLRVRVDHDTRPHDANLGDEPGTLFNLTVRDGATGVGERVGERGASWTAAIRLIALEHVDRVHLEAADVLDEPYEAGGRERAASRPGQMLSLEEERGDRAQRQRGSGHRARAYHRVADSAPFGYGGAGGAR